MRKIRDLFVNFMLTIIGILGVMAVIFAITPENSVLYYIFGIATLFSIGWLIVYLCLFKLLAWLWRSFWSIIKW